MKIGIIGSGMVGQTLGAGMAERGNEVVIGSRTPGSLDEKKGQGESLGAWLDRVGAGGRVDTFSVAAAFGEILFNATPGTVSLDALKEAGEKNLNGKILVDVANPLDFSGGTIPTLSVCNDDSLGERIQMAFPKARVVKVLNTVNAAVMVAPESVGGGDHDLFICGNDGDAKAEVSGLLKSWFGWKSIIDLGDITNARGTEMLLPLWVRLYASFQSPMFNFKIAR
jgi:predicted dinucleotide-binding enzyme